MHDERSDFAPDPLRRRATDRGSGDPQEPMPSHPLSVPQDTAAAYPPSTLGQEPSRCELMVGVGAVQSVPSQELRDAAQQSARPSAAPPPPRRVGRYSMWMTANRAALCTKRLSDVKLLGTHDSATYAITPERKPTCSSDAEPIVMKLLCNPCFKGVASAITVPWARCQEHTVLGQLRRGVRYLDLRLGIKTDLDPIALQRACRSDPNFIPRREEVWTCHSVWGSPFSEVVRDIADFMASLPAGHCETLVVDIQSADGFTHERHHRMLIADLQPIRRWVIRNHTNIASPLGAIWENHDERIFFIHRNAHEVSLLSGVDLRPRPFFLCSRWLDANSPDTLVQKLRDLLNLKTPLTQPVPPHQLVVTQGVLTPRGSDIVTSFLCCCCATVTTIADLAELANSQVLALWEGFDPAAVHDPVRDHRNVLMLDFFDKGRSPNGLSPIDLIITLNGGTTPPPPPP